MMTKKVFLNLTLLLFAVCSFGQENSEAYLRKYDIIKDSINELTFKDKVNFNNFITTFENAKGFELPKFLIIDDSGRLLKHKLDVWISECGKGDVAQLKKKYFKKLPSLEKLNMFFNEKITMPSKDNFVVVFIWHEATDTYNKHTFETYDTWKENTNIKFYFLNLEMN